MITGEIERVEEIEIEIVGEIEIAGETVGEKEIAGEMVGETLIDLVAGSTQGKSYILS